VSQADVDDIASDIDGHAATDLLPLIAPQWDYNETYVRDMTAEISFQASVNTGAGPGTRAGSAVEAHSAILVMRKSGLVGRSANGRVYGFGGTFADRADVAHWALAYGNAWASFCTGVDSLLSLRSFLPVIASPTLKLATGQVLLSTFEIVTWIPSLNIAAWRDRSNSQ
jgi:hypothetical protein